mmetsp:Transcript_15071/g.50033  ORF Transcript_15071/g.50033 Transcript_15071/m.50033 type:complete len:283 (-) Transcript_15071:195-1043(-)
MATKHIFITGGNAGIGFALCKLLVGEREDTFVFLGSRDAEKGAAAVKSISDAYPAAADRIALVAIDVGDEASVAAAAAALQAKSVTLYALVNNAGVGFQTSPGDAAALLNVNLLGPKRVSEAILPLIDPAAGRIVNVSSGAASMWLRSQSAETKELFTSRSATWEQLAAAVEELAPAASMGGYGLSKAALTAYTLQQAAAHPNLTITSLSPGYIKTAMTAGSGARLTPEQGTVSMMRCLFGEVTSGYYYGSDALRSPMTVTRDPGTPEYGGEENPDAATYNR